MQGSGTESCCRVVLVDDHALVREGLRATLEAHGMEIVGEAADGEDAIRIVLEAAPDVVIMDLEMPVLSGLAATRRLTTLAPVSKVVVLTATADEEVVVEAIMAGASGYLLKGARTTELVSAIQAVAVGESMISTKIAGSLLERLRERQVVRPEGGEGAKAIRAALTVRELEILKLLAAGKENAEIANELHVSPHTVKNQVASILAKLQLENRIQAAVHAVRSGIA